jgi:hypothetical protein
MNDTDMLGIFLLAYWIIAVPLIVILRKLDETK